MKKVIMFSASWCGPCKAAKPIFNLLKESTENVIFEIVDVEEKPEMATNFNINSVPTFVCLEDDKETYRVSGAQQVLSIKNFLGEKDVSVV